ncbi:DNA topoisomerase [Gemelliphila palaticanis]|uniref:DNA topoisomerase n=1 Tax=Gemelliphila palaticanis TaxID=81950 RepID=A0ABX2T053_9BACL|nr:DNA topoisomerase [Gemella palaticanis]MBF0716087.1 DNA topoisomerase [Gemella palaticanis]NYS48017.1 DNA topoisomerase [Gemella palaticanis]
MKLIICEKPSLAMNVAKAIDILKREKGYIVCKNNYLVSFAYGHLLTLKELKDYTENKGKKWNEYILPFIPNKFEEEIGKNPDRKSLDKGKKEQLEILKYLSTKVECIINCGDADREGQIIIDNIIKFIGYKGTVKRLWLPEQTEETIVNQLKILKDNDYYKNLRNEGYARRYIDWLYGMNITIFLTTKTSTIFNAGRVLIPIVKFIYDRDLEIKNFVSEPYFTLESNTNDIILKFKENFKEKKEADLKEKDLNRYKAVVKDITSKDVKKFSKKLFSLSTLQSELSKKYKISFSESLPIIQKLYESGFITYPRTNTEYLLSNEFDKVSSIIEKLLSSGYKNLENKNKKSIYDDSKIESHSAITITNKLPKSSEIDDKERIIYKTILMRFLSNFTNEDTIVSERTMLILVGNEEFKLKGNTILNLGFYRYEPKEFKDKLPNLKIGESFDVNFKILDKMTQPPNHLTESELSNLLKNPFRKESKEETDDDEYKAIMSGIEIGTEATRTGIIDNAIRVGYISKDKQSFKITDKGVDFIELLKKLNINLFKEKSVEISMLLKKIYKNEITIKEAINKTEIELKNIINNEVEVEKINYSKDNSIGNCPECSNEVVENSKAYTCKNKECRFVIFKENNFWAIRNSKLTKSMVKDILTKKVTKTTKFKTKDGKEYPAKVKYLGINEKGYTEFALEFSKKNYGIKN